MKYAIFSDIHSNIQALKAALEVCDKRKVDEIVCLGDVIGYNANPRECLEIAQNRFKLTIQGNHDKMVAQGVNSSDWAKWNAKALQAIEYTISKITTEDKQWLSSLPNYSVIDDPKIPFSVGHGMPFECKHHDVFDYIIFSEKGRSVMKEFKSHKDNIRLAFFGHTHIPAIFRDITSEEDTRFMDSDMGGYLFDYDIALNEVGLENVVKGDEYIFINPGSIGQPRTECPPSFAILDTDEAEVELVKFDYDYKSAQEAIRKEGYCDALADRLDYERD